MVENGGKSTERNSPISLSCQTTRMADIPLLCFGCQKKCFFVMGNDSRSVHSFCLKIACMCVAVAAFDVEIEKNGVTKLLFSQFVG